MAYVIAGLLFGTMSALIAHGKARNALGWFVAGCLTGPFGLVVALLPMGLKDGVSRKCAFCQEPVPIEAKLCKHCGSDLRGIAPV
ncbi:MAG: zinc ribbon domain-containing protein [Deltaproteobacteria bacterium]|nr:zinc ribbon domain-containing protein [Deltaproteobacteria bacterium]